MAGPSIKTVGKALKSLDLDGHELPPSPAPSTPTNGRKYALATELVYTEANDQYNASSMPIYQSATFKGGPGQEYDYTRSGNPTRTHLERHLAKIMNANRALVAGSGMGALDVITRLLKPGDEVVTGDDLYGGTNRLLTYLKENGGIIVHHVDTTNLESVTGILSEKTTMVLLETPTNPLIKVVDITGISAAAHAANSKAIVAVDNTMLSPYLQNPLDLGADVVYESGTKYLEEHGFKVRYPGLKSHPQYKLHWSQARGAGAVLSFETGSINLSERIVESTKLFGISVSFGCVNSLISMPCRMSHASIDPATRKERALPEDIIRLCIGIEDLDDLKDDLAQALVRAGAVRLTESGFTALPAEETIGQTGLTTQVVDEP
jgi:cystathionine beta-lyase/cystathionine gamma-synthase